MNPLAEEPLTSSRRGHIVFRVAEWPSADESLREMSPQGRPRGGCHC